MRLGFDSPPAIEIQGLSKTFGRTVAVDGLSFTADPGRLICFLGPNGAGKTTTLRMVLGLVEPTAGADSIGGRAYAQLDRPADRRGRVGGVGLSSGPQRLGRQSLL